MQMHVCMHVSICFTHTEAYIYTYVYMYLYTYICKYSRTHVYTHVCTHVHIHVCAYVYMNISIYLYIYIYIYVDMHTDWNHDLSCDSVSGAGVHRYTSGEGVSWVCSLFFAWSPLTRALFISTKPLGFKYMNNNSFGASSMQIQPTLGGLFRASGQQNQKKRYMHTYVYVGIYFSFTFYYIIFRYVI